MTKFTVFEPGTVVVIGGDIQGTVTAVIVRGVERHVSYEVAWWDGTERKVQWLDAMEVLATELKPKRLGF